MTRAHPTLTPQPGILDIAPYVGGESAIGGANRVTKLSSNENPLGPSPWAREAYLEVAGKLERYPNSDHGPLRAALGEVHGLDPERIICSNGSDEVIGLLAQGYAGPGSEVIHTEHGFAMYKIAALAAGATPVQVAEKDRHSDVDAILAACTERTKLVYLANPNNPTGTLIADAEITRLAESLPAQALLVLDGAYAEYVEAPGFDAGAALVGARDNVVMTRTFSKVYGLAALRVGWAYAPAHVIDVLHRLRGPFNVNAAALAAAEAALRDVDYTAHCVAENALWRDWLAEALAAIDLPSDPSHGNFILVRFGAAERANAADACLRRHGVIVRSVAGYGLAECLRITIGDAEACHLVASLLREFVEGEQV